MNLSINKFRAYCNSDINSMYANIIDIKSIDEINERYRMRVLNRKYWPYHVKVENESDIKERWCYENFKSSEWRNVGTYFAFKRGEDATLFTLKWS